MGMLKKESGMEIREYWEWELGEWRIKVSKTWRMLREYNSPCGPDSLGHSPTIAPPDSLSVREAFTWCRKEDLHAFYGRISVGNTSPTCNCWYRQRRGTHIVCFPRRHASPSIYRGPKDLMYPPVYWDYKCRKPSTKSHDDQLMLKPARCSMSHSIPPRSADYRFNVFHSLAAVFFQAFCLRQQGGIKTA